MRIVVDGRMACWTGVGRYITGLCRAMPQIDGENEYFLLQNPGDDARNVPETGKLQKVFCRSPIPPYSLKEQLALRKEVSRFQPDLVHVPHFNAPRFGRLPFVVTIHDLIYLLFPEDCPSRFAFWAARRMIRSAVRRAEKILTDSENTRADLIRLLKVDPSRIRVTHLGPPSLDTSDADPRRVREQFGLRGDYLLYTGNHSPHKNLKTLLDAFALLRKDAFDLQLVITGPKDRHTPSVVAHVAQRGLSDRVVFTGNIADRDLSALYAGAAVLVFPSLYEGFGLPPLEAFATGVPVVASNAASLPEVLGDAALLVDPLNSNAFRDAIARVIREDDLRETLVSKGRKQLAKYSWTETARNTLEVYREALQSTGRDPA
ncbi:MAG: glycosyltransferase family 4 protein [Planctomycetota bacterium]|jgi:glycosyltransferase involved in cell wall biosynthesis